MASSLMLKEKTHKHLVQNLMLKDITQSQKDGHPMQKELITHMLEDRSLMLRVEAHQHLVRVHTLKEEAQ